MNLSFRLAALSLALFAGPLCRPARAADGRIPISSAPFTISAPGSYYVTQDLSLAAGNMITISASDVNLDLMNHTLTHSGSTAGNSVIISNGAYSNLRVTGGRITGGYTAVNLGIGVAYGFYQIDHLIISGQGFSGILINPTAQIRVLIENNSVTAVGGMCMQMNRVENSRIERNVISHCNSGSNAGRGLYLFSGNNNLISQNVVTANASDGIYLSSCSQNTLDGNVSVSNGATGFSLLSGAGNVYSNNRMMNNAGSNIYTGGISAGGNNAGAANF